MSIYSYVGSQGYANRYNAIQSQHLDQLREEILGTKEDAAAMNRKLSAETNKRRREIVNRKREREDLEQQRRMAILAERRAKMHDATQRFQRGSAPKQNHRKQSPSPRANSRGRRAVSAPVRRPPQIDLDSALKQIRGVNTIQFTTGDSGASFIQKYGAFKQVSPKEGSDGTGDMTRSVANLLNNHQSQYETQLRSHQAILDGNRPKPDQAFHTGGSNMNNNHISNNNDVGNDINDEDIQSFGSSDSLEDHNTTSNPILSHNTSSSANQTRDDSQEGGGTYRQESPSVVKSPDQLTPERGVVYHKMRVSSAPVGRSRMMVPDETSIAPQTHNQERPPIPCPPKESQNQTRLGQTQGQNKTNSINHSQATNHHQQIQHHSQAQSHFSTLSNTTTSPQMQVANNHSEQFYLKSRTEPQMIAQIAPTAWTSPAHEADQSEDIKSTKCNRPSAQSSQSNQKSNSKNFSKITNHSALSDQSELDNQEDEDLLDESPKSILKRSSSDGMLGSKSTPNIRDSLDVAKGNYSKQNQVATRRSAKKSVRFATEHMPAHSVNVERKQRSGIPLPQAVNMSKPIVPRPGARPVSARSTTRAAALKRGPVVADHSLVNSNSTAAETSEEAPQISLNKTPTDDEIEQLWDKVRLCLESPTNSARSAPPTSISSMNHRASPADSVRSAPEPRESRKPPIKKITASDINQIGRPQPVQQNNSNNSTQLQDGPLLQQRQRQEPRGFSSPGRNGNTPSGPPRIPGSGPTFASNGGPHHAAMGGWVTMNRGPPDDTESSNYMVNNTPSDVSESMAMFLAAEKLAENSDLTESRILDTVTDQQYRQELRSDNRPAAPMTALSMEEQRLLQSLDRLNLKLKTVEENSQSRTENQALSNFGHSPYQSKPAFDNSHPLMAGLTNHNPVVHKPRPPNGVRGFKGHRPIQGRGRTLSVEGQNGNPTQFRLY